MCEELGQEFLNQDNRGLDILVEYLSFAQCAVMLDVEGVEVGQEGLQELSKSWSRSIEDVQLTGSQPFCNTLVRYSSVANTRTMKKSRLVSQKDDVHVCIMCLRAIMNYQYGFNMVMSHPHAVNEIALSLNNKNSRTKALVLELLAAVCLVRGGHEIILSAFDHFKEVCKERQRFERLMDYFRCEEGNIDLMNSKHTESDKLSVQIQAYLDNVFDVGGLLEDAETKNAALEKVDELEEHLSHVTEKLLDVENETMMKVADLEKVLLQKDKELHVMRETYESTSTQVNTLRRVLKEKDAAFQRHFNIEKRLLELEQQGTIRLHKKPDGDIAIEPLAGGGGGVVGGVVGGVSITGDRGLGFPLADLGQLLPPGPAIGLTAPRGLDPQLTRPAHTLRKEEEAEEEEDMMLELDLERFEELFKTRAQGPMVDLSSTTNKVTHKAVNKVTLLDTNRSKNLAITLRKANKSTEEICKAIEKFDLKALPVDFVECLMRFLPTEAEVKVMRQYERERRPLDQLAEEDRFMLLFSKIERLTQRMNIITFVGNFADNIAMLTPQLNAVIAASGSVKSSPKLRRMLEIILALGNYMNSSKRGSVYGFKLQSLDLLLDTKSTDRRITLLHYIALIVKEKYCDLANFYSELHYVDKAAAVSLENVLLDVRELAKGMELIRRECSQHDHAVLKAFLQASQAPLEQLQKDAKASEAKEHDPKVQATKKKQQQQELIAELRKRQAKDHRPVYEGKDGTIEDIITGGPGGPRGPDRSAGGPRGPRVTLVIARSAPRRCTLCYVVESQAPPLEQLETRSAAL
ncbi:hypothetical protein CRUP_036706 [Coryphaenoides rupestris]|nr:hypothetical protein CRUP_036706 [Coryphaenoides rupestris]